MLADSVRFRTAGEPEPLHPEGMVATATIKPEAAVIGPSMRIKGEIRSGEQLLVDGEVEGLLESQSVVTVGQKGKVKANIKAHDVVIYGEVKGNVEVSGKIAIRENGSLIGDVQCAGISIDDGAYFKGSIDIMRVESKPPEAPRQPAPASRT
jgi:cytoskeletal protein CcmA (bactofilin family)